MDQLQGRVAVITGGASGVGRGLALAFVDEGMSIVLADLDETRLHETTAELQARGADVLPVPTDVTSAAAVDRLAEETLARYGAVHVVCNNVGASSVGYEWETDLADWKSVFDVNVWGTVNGIRTFVPIMLDQPDGGYVVNVASTAGVLGAPLAGPYVASKHAVVGLTKSLRKELAMRGGSVGVSLVCPGGVQTTMSSRIVVSGGASRASMRPEVSALLDMLQDPDVPRMAPETVGRIIADAVREGRFWVLPNAEAHLTLAREEYDELFNDIP